jgi:hypothetical protein
MWNQLRDAVLWTQALDRYSRQEFDEAIAKLKAITGHRSKASEYFALLGSAHTVLARPEGRAWLMRAVTGIPTRAEYQSYVRAYCEYYLAILDGNDGAAIMLLEGALRMSAPPIIRRWLPLS